MATIAGVRIQPGFFKKRLERERPRAGAGVAPVRVKGTAVHKPSAPRAKYAMPVIVVVAAMGTFAAGAGIAMAAGATMGAMVVGGMMMVGAAMTIVGTFTENKNLVKWGAILSVVGGIGAGVLGAMGGLTEAATAASEASTAGAIAAPPAEAVADAAAGGAAATPGAVPSVVPPVEPPSGLLASAPVAEVPPVTPPAAAPGVPPPEAAPLTPDATTQLAPQGAKPFDPNSVNPWGPGDNPYPFRSPGVPAATSTPGGFFDTAGRWVKDNKELAQMGATGVSGLLASAVPRPMTEAEKANADYARRRAAQLDANSAWWRQTPR